MRIIIESVRQRVSEQLVQYHAVIQIHVPLSWANNLISLCIFGVFCYWLTLCHITSRPHHVNTSTIHFKQKRWVFRGSRMAYECFVFIIFECFVFRSWILQRSKMATAQHIAFKCPSQNTFRRESMRGLKWARGAKSLTWYSSVLL